MIVTGRQGMAPSRRGAGRLVQRSVRIAVGLSLFSMVWLVSCNGEESARPDLAPFETEPVADPTGVVYLVELRSRPDYRLVAYDMDSTTTTPVFVVPEFGAISSIAVSPDGRHLGLAYTDDYSEGTAGIYLLDTDPGATADGPRPRPVLDELPDVVLDDIEFGLDGSTVWVDVVELDGSSVISVDLATGEVVDRIEDAVEPAPGDGWVAFLRLEADRSRRSVGLLDLETGETSTVDILGGAYDLGHLVADPHHDRLYFTALVPKDQTRIEIGDRADAHGSHGGAAQWLSLDLATGAVGLLAPHEPIAVRDATLLGPGQVVVTTADGLVMINDPPLTIVESTVLGELAG